MDLSFTSELPNRGYVNQQYNGSNCFLCFVVVILCSQNRKNNQNVLEWGQHHARYVEMWMQRLGSRETDMTLAEMRDYKETHMNRYDNGRRFRVRRGQGGPTQILQIMMQTMNQRMSTTPW